MQVWWRYARWYITRRIAELSPGKVLRDGAGQASNRSDEEVLDLVITNALIIDWSGIYKVRKPKDHPLYCMLMHV